MFAHIMTGHIARVIAYVIGIAHGTGRHIPTPFLLISYAIKSGLKPAGAFF